MGLSSKYQYFMYLVGFTIMMIINIKYHQRYIMTKRRAVIYTIITYFLGVGGAMCMARVYNYLYMLKGVEETGRVAIFGSIVFTPLMLLVVISAEKIFIRFFGTSKSSGTDKKRKKKEKGFPVSYRNTFDLLTPGIYIILTCAKFGCFLGGCCFGIVCNFGLHSEFVNATVFPVQICEAVSMAIMIVVIDLIIKKGKLKPGMAFPFTTAIYSVIRFFWEFLRYYEPEVDHYFWFMSVTQFFCAVIFVISLISLLCLKIYTKKEMQQQK